jgi:hypothetical protein
METIPLSSRVEKSPVPKLVLAVPVGWGTERFTDYERRALHLSYDDPVFQDELLARAKASQEIRELALELGMTIQEIEKPLSEQEDYQFVVRGGDIPLETEVATVREVALEIRIPRTTEAKEYSKEPFLPAVVVFPGRAGGEGKYLLETPEQQNSFLAFLSKEGRSLRNDFAVKEFIDTPGSHFTSYRVIVSAKGKILASGLLYSGDSKEDHAVLETPMAAEELGQAGTNWLDYLEAKESPYCLHSRRFTSNIARGGNCIPLDPTENSRKISEEERSLLAEHGLEDAALPPAIREAAAKIGVTLGKQMGLFVGVDFMQDTDGNFYYLETNAGPGMKTYLACNNKGEGTEAEGCKMAMREIIIDLAHSNS